MTLLSRRKTRLSYAILPLDEFTLENKLKGDCYFVFKGRKIPHVRHRSGHLLLFDMPSGKHRVGLTGKSYLKNEIEIDTGKLDPKAPAENIKMKPGPDYLFPRGTTLLKGIITDAGGKAVAGSDIKVQTRNETASTDNKGRFVLYFKGISGDGPAVQLYIKKSGFRIRKPDFKLTRGKTTEVLIKLTRAGQ